MNPEEQNQTTTNDLPDIPAEEMKLPENNFGAPAEKHSMLGPILVVLIVILILILGGLYIWGSMLQPAAPVVETPVPAERPTPEENDEPESTTAEAAVETLQTVSTSDEIEAIEADLESTDLDALDAELNAIDAELDAALEAS